MEKGIIVLGSIGGGYESSSRVYSTKGCAPTILSRDYKDAKKIAVICIRREL